MTADSRSDFLISNTRAFNERRVESIAFWNKDRLEGAIELSVL